MSQAMDKLSVISGSLFLVADIFAICSLAVPKWIVSDVAGPTDIGLLRSCITVYGRDTTCYSPEPHRPEWVLTFVLIVLAIISNTVTVILLMASYWKRDTIKVARWTGFISMVLFCMAAVIFPKGFDMADIGGLPYQLPSSFRVGLSYILFMLALWLTVISELFAGKVCLPHF